MSTPLPENENERLSKLISYEILDTPPEYSFDQLAQLAARIFDVPYSQITFVSEQKVFLKANATPWKGNEISRDQSLCAIAILRQGATVFEDTHEIPQQLGNALINTDNGIRFYAGHPLTTFEGYQLGTISVLDTVPRIPTQKQLDMLGVLAALVMDKLEMRLTTRKAIRTQTDMMNKIIHDLKNPNTTISLSAELIKKKADTPKIVNDFADRIRNSASQVLVRLNELLDLSQIENASFRLNLNETNISDLLETSKRKFALLAAQKQQQITVNCQCSGLIVADASRLQEAFNHLLSNAIKFSDAKTSISIEVNRTADELLIAFKDRGQGLALDEMERLFTKFAKLSSRATANEGSNGLGLSTAKMLVELHRGKLWAESLGIGNGMTFFVSLPLN